MTSLWLSKHIAGELDARKDTYFRILNNERFNWLKLIYKLATKVIASADQTPLQQKVIIADDTISNKSGAGYSLTMIRPSIDLPYEQQPNNRPRWAHCFGMCQIPS